MNTQICFTAGEFFGYILLLFLIRYTMSYFADKKDDTFNDYASTAFMAILMRVIWVLL